MNSVKVDFMQIRRSCGLNSKKLADTAGLPLSVEYRAEIGVPVSQEVASQLLGALSQLTGQTYTLDTVGIEIGPSMPHIPQLVLPS
jgi:hypothetical protein